MGKLQYQVCSLFKQNQDLTSILRTCAIERNKRCLIAYHMKRLEKIKQLRWELGPVIPSHIRQGIIYTV